MLILMNTLVGNNFLRHDDVKQKLGSIILISCSDNYINSQLIEIDQAFDFVENWFTWPMLLLLLNLYIDYCGLELSYGGTWNRMLRKAKRIFRCRGREKGEEFTKIKTEESELMAFKPAIN